MFLLSILSLAAALFCFTRMLPLSAEKQQEGQLFAEDEERLGRLRRRVFLFSGLSLLFTFLAVSGDLW